MDNIVGAIISPTWRPGAASYSNSLAHLVRLSEQLEVST